MPHLIKLLFFKTTKITEHILNIAEYGNVALKVFNFNIFEKMQRLTFKEYAVEGSKRIF